MNDRKVVRTVYTGSSKAFDSVDSSLLLNKFRSYGVQLSIVLSWLRWYLSGTFPSMILLFFSLSETWGSTLGSSLFSFFINNLPSSVGRRSRTIFRRWFPYWTKEPSIKLRYAISFSVVHSEYFRNECKCWKLPLRHPLMDCQLLLR